MGVGNDHDAVELQRKGKDGERFDWTSVPTWEDQTCPCNCSYTSRACCRSWTEIFLENPSLNIRPVHVAMSE